MTRLHSIRSTVRSSLSGLHPLYSVGHGHHRFIWRRVVTKAIGAVAIISIFAVAAASQQPSNSANSAANNGSTKKSNSSKVELHSTTDKVQSSVQSQGGTTMNETNNQSSPGVSNTNSSSVQVNVNGQDIPVPENGSTQKTITGSDGSTTTVNVSNNTSSDGTSFNSSFTSRHVTNFNSEQTNDTP